MRKILLLYLILLLPISSFARFEKLVGEIDELLAPVKGYVVAVDSDSVYTDLGKNRVSKGRVFEVFREGQKIIHPITGEVLGVKRAYLGQIKITDVFDKYSIAKIIEKKSDIKKGDTVISEVPVSVDVSFENFNKRLEILLKQDLGDAQNFVLKDNAKYHLFLKQDDKGGIEYSLFLNDELIAKKYFADINMSYFGKGKPSLMTADILRSKPINKELRTLTVGRIFDDDFEYVVTADEDTVYVYKFTGEGFEYITKVDGDFDEILNVETMDLNGNGVDEIFITNLSNGRNIKSAIYEFDGKRAKLLKKNIPFIFRTIMINGHKKLVCQRISRDGEYLGKIHFYEYKTDYVRGDAIEGTNGIGVFGFGYGDIDKDKRNEILFLDKDFHLNIVKNYKKIYKSNEQYGKTIYYFMLENEKKVKKEHINRNEDNPFEILYHKKFLKGRVFVYNEGKIYILKNEQLSDVLPNLLKFKGSVFVGYIWQGKMLRKIWDSDVFKPIIVDYYGEERFGKNYVVLLRNYDKGLFSGTKSEFIYMEIK